MPLDSTTAGKLLPKNDGSELELDIRTSKITGRPVLHFPYMAVSDVHWGSRFSRAKRLCMALRDFESDELKGLGDMVGGIELEEKNKWHLGPWHRQGMALVIEKAETSAVTFLDGNHEIGLEERIRKPKRYHGVEFRQSSSHRDPTGRLFLEEHGDRYDLEVFKTPEQQDKWHRIGNSLHHMGGEIDHVLQEGLGFEKASAANWGKRMLKTYINQKMGVLAAMERAIDASHFDGNVSGHSHMMGFHRTPGGKLLINDGSCTDHVQFAVHDRQGNWGLIEHHRDRMNVEMESGKKYTVFWKDHGLDHFSEPPQAKETIHTDKADRFLRVAYHLWPSRDRRMVNQQIKETDRAVDRLMVILSEAGEKPGAAPLHWALHHAQTQLADLHAAREANSSLPAVRKRPGLDPAVRSQSRTFSMS